MMLSSFDLDFAIARFKRVMAYCLIVGIQLILCIYSTDVYMGNPKAARIALFCIYNRLRSYIGQ